MDNIGFKKYTGSSQVKHNIQMSLVNEFNFDDVSDFDNDLLNQKIQDLSELHTEIYVWASIDSIDLRHNDWMIFYIESDKTLYCYQFIDNIFDDKEEIYEYVGWKKSGYKDEKGNPKKEFHNVVFLKNKKKNHAHI